MTGSADDAARRIAPGPGGNPITNQLTPFERDPLRFLLDARREHGDVVRLRLWPQLYHLICRPDSIRHVLATHGENYHWLPGATDGARPQLGEGPRVYDVARSRRMGRLAHQISHQQHLGAYAGTMTDAVEGMLSRWQRH